MKNLFTQLFSRLASYFIFASILIFAFACILTGEFPPKITSVIQLKKNFSFVNKVLNDRVKMLDHSATSGETVVPLALALPSKATSEITNEPTNDSSLAQNIQELRTDQMRVSNQLEKVLEQNRQILQKLNSLQK